MPPSERLKVPAPDGEVHVILQPWISDDGEVRKCGTSSPTPSHTTAATYIALVNSWTLEDVMLCDSCAETLMEGHGEVMFGL